LWWHGINVACDAGTYLYNGERLWQNALSGTAVHNTVTVDGRDQMTRAGRFLWLDWADGAVESRTASRIAGYHRGFAPVIHKRTVYQLGADSWEIVDSLYGDYRSHIYRLQWLLADAPHEWNATTRRLILHYPGGDYCVGVDVAPNQQESEVSLVRADPNSVRGWRSRFYVDRQPALSLVLAVHAQEVTFTTRFMLLPTNLS
jgi:hypothetical protein